MREAAANGKLVVAGPDAPDKAVCPDCGTEVKKRHVRRMDGGITYFYRHKRGEVKGCPRRYRPTQAFQTEQVHRPHIAKQRPSVPRQLRESAQ